MGTRYRVLSLDGGGSWALIQAKALIKLYGANTSGWDVLRKFDLVAANSGGAIVLGCLVENFTLQQILDLFITESKRRSIFSPTSSIGDNILEKLAHIGPKYSAAKKLIALQTILPGQGNKPLSAAIAGALGQRGTGDSVRLLIIGFDYDRLRAAFFRSAPTGGPAYGTGEVTTLTLAETIHASSNAPVNYFDGPALFPDSDFRFWDGGITGCNNPVLAGVTEAVTATKSFTEVIALSIGTGTVALPWPTPADAGSPYVRKPSPDGFVNDLKKLAGAILDDPPDMASFIAHVLTGSGAGAPPAAGSQIVRMNPMISPVRDPATGRWTAPGGLAAAQFLGLAALDMDAIHQSDVDSIAAYADLWLAGNAPNQPIRMNGDSLHCEIGQSTFPAAQAAWNSLITP